LTVAEGVHNYMLMSWTAECHEGKITTLTVAADGHATASSLSVSVVEIGNRELRKGGRGLHTGKAWGEKYWDWGLAFPIGLR